MCFSSFSKNWTLEFANWRLIPNLVMGVDVDGQKHLIASEEGYRESKESWLEVLRHLRDRGMQAPVLAVGDGALGFLGRVTRIWPDTKSQRCWVSQDG
jgi:transposase-like protein